MVAGSSLGGVIIPIMADKLIPKVGFRWSVSRFKGRACFFGYPERPANTYILTQMRIIAFLILFMMIIANLTVTSRTPPFKRPIDIAEFIAPLKEVPFDLVAFGSFLIFLGYALPLHVMRAKTDRRAACSFPSIICPLKRGVTAWLRALCNTSFQY